MRWNSILRQIIYLSLSSCIVKRRTNIFRNRWEFNKNVGRFFTFATARGFLWEWFNEKEQGRDNDSKVDFIKSSRKRDNFIVEVSRRCAPSVVYIEIKDLRKIAPDTGNIKI